MSIGRWVGKAALVVCVAAGCQSATGPESEAIAGAAGTAGDGMTTAGGRGGGSGANGSHAGEAGAGAAGGEPAIGGSAGSTSAGGSGGETTVGLAGAAGEAGWPGTATCTAPKHWSETLVECSGGFVHRPLANAVCPLPARDTTVEGLSPTDGVYSSLASCDPYDGQGFEPCVRSQCTRDADCGALGYCLLSVYESSVQDDIGEDHEPVAVFEQYCATPCGSDADCATDELCACDHVTHNATGETVSLGVCYRSSCHADGECGDGYLCASPLNEGTLGDFHCQTAEDECRGPAECPGTFGPCSEPGCVYSFRLDEPGSGTLECTTLWTCIDP